MFGKTIVFLALTLGHLSAAAHEHGHTGAEATYLGNEAIMVTEDGAKILFDPLFPNGFGIYQMVPSDMRSALMAGEAPYDNVDAIFVSHMHADHFEVGAVIAYLERHLETRLYAPQQAVELMKVETDPDSAIFDRVIGIGLERLDTPETYTLGDIQIDAVRIPHAGWPGRAEISNLVFRATLPDGTTVMHMGDADPNLVHFEPYEDHWNAKRTDTAFPPYWFFLGGDGPLILSQTLNAKTAVGVHVPMVVPADLIASGADYLSVPGETRAVSDAD
ncbi:MAG: MBL fold metallo-hydrolase [Henriciella sp.]|nr:MBL fold metallo-hydrolase [Henriciella sp.]